MNYKGNHLVKWTQEELDFLIERRYMQNKDLAKAMGKSTQAIASKRFRLYGSAKLFSDRDAWELVIKHAYIKPDEYIAKITKLEIGAVRVLKKRLFDKKNDRPYKYDTLCVYCKNCTGFCPWSKSFKVVDGWEAVKKILRYGKNHEKEQVTYAVKECPMYERG